MKRLILLTIITLVLYGSAFGQTSGVTGKTYAPGTLTPTLRANLPVPGDLNRIWSVTDCADSTCATGGGSVNVKMTWNGSAYAAVGGASGGGTVTEVTGTAPINVATGTTTPVISLNDTAVTPASYTYAGFTVDAKGRLTVAASGAAPEVLTNKDVTGGYAGLTGFKINFKNAANTFTSFLQNSNTAARTYTFQNRDGTIADDTDLATKQATVTFGANVQTALGVAIGSAGAPVLLNGAGGTPSSLTGTNITGTASGLTAGNVTTNANSTGDVTSVGNATTIAAGVIVNADVNASAAIDATKLADGTVTSAELQFIGTLSSNAQTQIDTKQSTLTNSAGLRAALSDENGDGAALFNNATSPNFTTGVTTGAGTTAGGSIVEGNATGDTAASFFEANSGDAASNAEPAYLKLWSSHSTKRKAALFACTDADGVFCIATGTPAADSSNFILSVTNTATGISNKTFVAPVLGAATATSLNGLTVTTSTGTLTVTNGKTLSASNTLTLTGTDSSSVAFGAGGTVSYTIVSGTSALGTSAISSATCATAVTTTATGAATTDVVTWGFNTDVTGITGYAPATEPRQPPGKLTERRHLLRLARSTLTREPVLTWPL